MKSVSEGSPANHVVMAKLFGGPPESSIPTAAKEIVRKPAFLSKAAPVKYEGATGRALALQNLLKHCAMFEPRYKHAITQAATVGMKNGKKKRGAASGGQGLVPQLSPLSVLPFQLTTTHFFTEYDQLLSAATSASLTLKINTVYDPDPHILGGSVPGVSEFAAFYKYFRVMAFRVRLTVMNTSQNFNSLYVPVFLGAWPARVVASGSESYLTAAAQPLAVSGIADHVSALETITPWISVPFLIGRTDEEYASNVNYWGQGTIDPAVLVYYNLMLFAPSASSAVVNYSIEFKVVWFERLELNS